MNPEQIRQLANLLKELQRLNQIPGRLYVGEAIIYDGNDQPIAKLGYYESDELALLKIYSNDLETV